MKKDVIFYYIDGYNNISFKNKSKDKAFGMCLYPEA
jgi:hypothetical protein